MRVYDYLEKASLYWAIIGTITVVTWALKGFEFSLYYLLVIIVLWGIMVGFPAFTLHEVGRLLSKRSQPRINSEG